MKNKTLVYYIKELIPNVESFSRFSLLVLIVFISIIVTGTNSEVKRRNVAETRIATSITIGNALFLLNQKTTLFVDVRIRQKYSAARIPGSINIISVSSISSEQLDKVKAARNVVVYGEMGDGAKCEEIATFIGKKLERRIGVMRDSWADWSYLGLPRETL